MKLTRITRHLTFANVAAGLALVIAVGGGGVAVAAALAPKNSVNSRAIINGAVKAKDLAGTAVIGSKVVDNSLTGADISEGTLGVVPQAARGRNLLSAVVSSGGGLITGQSHFAVSATQTEDGPGTYEVLFDRDITGCAAVATLGDVGSGGFTPGEISVTGRGGGTAEAARGLYVTTFNSAGTITAKPFRVLVAC